MTDIIVVGAGQAGSTLVSELRAGGFDGTITLIGAEAEPPYQRPPLSKGYLLGEMELERLYLRPQGWYTDNRVHLACGTQVEAIDRDARLVHAAGQTLPYDHLVLTTGSVPRPLPPAAGAEGLGGVHMVRTRADVDGMAVDVAPGRTALIVGGGYIGLEAAAVCAKRGMSVIVLEMAERILQRVACSETSDYFRDLHQSHGVEISEGVGLTRLVGDGHVAGAVLSDGREMACDMVVVGIGILPDTHLAEAAGLEIDNGIAVDAYGRTSDPHIWSAGDCASFPYGEGRLRLESVGNAIDMAGVVAKNILGAEEPYRARPWFWSDQYDVKLQIAGLNAGYDRVVVRGQAPSVSHWYYAGETLLAIDAMNDPRAYMIGKRLIEAGKSPHPDLIAEPETDLKALLKA